MKNPAATMGATYSGKLKWPLEKKTITHEELVEIIGDAMMTVSDMDTSFDDYAKAIADELILENLVEVTDEVPK